MLSTHIFNRLSTFFILQEKKVISWRELISAFCDIWLLLVGFEHISCLSLCYRQDTSATSH
jgi:hypothetical protein